MSNHEEVVAEPGRFASYASVSDPVILCPVGPIVVVAAALLGARPKIRRLFPAKVYSIEKGQIEASLVGPCMGAPVAVITLEDCIAQGVRHVIFFGFCGSIHPDVRIGEFVVPTSALSEEGTSAHYHPELYPAEPGDKALAAIRQALDSACLRYHQGRIWTCDAMYRETKEKVRRYGQEGILGVEMETSALFTVARFRGIELGALYIVTDELFDLEWRTGYTKREVLAAIRLGVRIAYNAALLLSETG